MAVGQEANVAGTAEFEAADRGLRKTMGFNHLLFLSVTAIIGSGWLFAALKSAALAGPAAIVAWAIGGAFIIFIAFTYMEPAGMLPRSGAIVRYPALTHGPWTGWLLGWAYWLSAITVPAIEAEAVVTYVGGQEPSSGILVTQAGVPEMRWPQGILFGIGLMLLFFCLNYFGVRLLSEVNRWLTWWKIIIPSLTAIFLFIFTVKNNYTSLAFGGTKGFAPYGTAAIFGAISSSGILFSYLGFRQALDYAGEAKNPQRHVPLATVLAVVIGFAVYVTIQIGFTGAVNWHNAGVHPGDWAGLLSSPWSASPLVDAFKAAGIGWLGTWATILVVDAGISPSATGWVYLGTSARTNYGLAVNGALPKTLERPNRWHIPWLSLVVALVIGCIFFIPTPSWYTLVGFISSATALTYIMGGTSTLLFRRFAPQLYRPYRLPFAWVMAPVGFCAAWMVVYWSGYSTLIQVYGAVFVGLPIFVWYYAREHGWFETPVKNWLAQGMNLVYLGTWCYIQWGGGWLLRVTPPASSAWSFPTYFGAQAGDVAFFCLCLWLLSGKTGRMHTRAGLWFIAAMWGLLPVSYYGYFGPEKVPAFAFPWGTLIALGIGLIAFGLALLSGFYTDELKAIVEATVGPKPPPGTAAVPGEEQAA
ncbi:MAG: APC family permease [Streptosporangiaceae bacterium]